MKELTFLLVFFLLPISALAQETQEAATSDGPFQTDVLGGLALKMTHINGKSEILIGGYGRWIINHEFALGMALYGLQSKTIKSDKKLGDLEFGYGGLELEYIIASYRRLYLSAQTLIGGGGLIYRMNNIDRYDDPYDTFFIFEPGFNVMVYATKYFRIGLGVNYRWMNGIEILELHNSALNAPSAMLTCLYIPHPGARPLFR